MVTIRDPADPVFRALADPVRREILTALSCEPMAVQPLADRFAISRPAISRHLRVLREAGLVDGRAAGRSNVYSLRPEPLAEVETWLRSLWDERLGRLKSLVEE
jgi:DNA-binding transcriptional ArsR family regulator